MSDKEKDALSALYHAISTGGYPSLISSKRWRRGQGRPGEIIEKLSKDTRNKLEELKSDHISLLDRDMIYYISGVWEEDRYNYQQLRLIEKFDREVLGLTHPRADRKKYG